MLVTRDGRRFCAFGVVHTNHQWFGMIRFFVLSRDRVGISARAMISRKYRKEAISDARATLTSYLADEWTACDPTVLRQAVGDPTFDVFAGFEALDEEAQATVAAERTSAKLRDALARKRKEKEAAASVSEAEAKAAKAEAEKALALQQRVQALDATTPAAPTGTMEQALYAQARDNMTSRRRGRDYRADPDRQPGGPNYRFDQPLDAYSAPLPTPRTRADEIRERLKVEHPEWSESELDTQVDLALRAGTLELD